MSLLFFWLSFFVYLISFVGFFFYFKTLRKEALRYTQVIFLIGFSCHTFSWIFKGYEIFLTSIFFYRDVLNFLSWALCLVYIIFSFFIRIKIYTAGFFLIPVVILLMGLHLILPYQGPTPFSEHIRNVWFPLHGFSGLFSHAFLLFGAVSSLMYLLQEREIKRKSLGLFYKKLPPLEYLDRACEKSLYLGFIFLTIAMISGAVWSHMISGTFWRWSPKEIISLILWTIYAVLIHQRVLIGWRGKRAAKMFMLGFLVWLISFFVINLFTEGFHTYG